MTFNRTLAISSFFVALALLVFVWWFSYNPVRHFAASVPGMDSVPAEQNTELQEVIIGEYFEKFGDYSGTLTGTWSRFRGDNFDNRVQNAAPLIKNFTGIENRIRWKAELGEGHAAPAIYKGRAYVFDYMEESKRDALRCFDLQSGKELWRRSYRVHVKRNHGMSRTIPAVTDNYLVTIGPMGHVMCVNPENGDFLWGLNTEKDYNAKIPFWYTGQCPLIDRGTAVIATGGKSILIGVDCASGKVLWETPNPDSLQMSHSSVMPMKLGGKETYVYAAVGGIVGISADAADIGKQLWQTKAFAPSVVAPSPLMLGNNQIFMTAGYGAGSVVMEVNPGNYTVKIISQFKPTGGLASEQQTPVLDGKRVYGILPKDAGALRNQMVCYATNNLNKSVWSSGKDARFGLGPYLLADGKFWILNDDGTLIIAKAENNGLKILDKYRVIEGQDAWGPLAYADGYLLLRDAKTLVCLDVKK